MPITMRNSEKHRRETNEDGCFFRRDGNIMVRGGAAHSRICCLGVSCQLVDGALFLNSGIRKCVDMCSE